MEKINFSSIQNELSRDEMKNIMAGTSGDGCSLTLNCGGTTKTCSSSASGNCHYEGNCAVCGNLSVCC